VDSRIYLRGYEREQRSGLLRPRRFARLLVAACAVLVVSAVQARAQQGSEQGSGQAPGQVSTQTTTVHGVVRVGVSGEPLPHALVRIGGDASNGVLTDGDGRFEIVDVPSGPQEFTITKPGFMDEAEAGADSIAWNAHGYGHNVIVAAQMGDVVFTMELANSIRGQIQLSTGDVAEGIQVMLLRRTIQDGRAVWQLTSNAKTNSEGVYRFGGLTDGSYSVYTMPAMDSEGETNFIQAGISRKVARGGYPSVFFPDARDLGSAAKIRLSGGEQAQANISLALEPFQPVVATVTMPRANERSDNVSVQVINGQGNLLPYTAQYDASTQTVQAMLPEGTYSLLATVTTQTFHIAATRDAGRFNMTPVGRHGFAGEVSFAVAARAVSNLRLPMTAMENSPVQVSVSRGANAPAQQGEGADPRVFVTLSQTGGWIADGMVSSYAEGPASRPLPSTGVEAGSYWVHTNIGSRTLCESSFTAGGASLAREPLLLGVAGSTAPLILSLRDDCAKLTLSLPGSVAYVPGEERAYTVYVVPDFDSTQDVVPQTLRTSTGGRIVLTGMTPGNYHVFTFDRPVSLEYRNPAVLGSLPSQAVALASNTDAELTVEVRQR
jgi:hypothetical protein